MDMCKILIAVITGFIVTIEGSSTIQLHICGQTRDNLTLQLTDEVNARPFYHPCEPNNSVLAIYYPHGSGGTVARIAGVAIINARNKTCLILDDSSESSENTSIREKIINSLDCRNKISIPGKLAKLRLRKTSKDQKNIYDDETNCNNNAAVVLGILFGFTLLALLFVLFRTNKKKVAEILTKRKRARRFQGVREEEGGREEASSQIDIGEPENPYAMAQAHPVEAPLDEPRSGYSTVQKSPNAVEEASSQLDIGDPEDPYAMAQVHPVEA